MNITQLEVEVDAEIVRKLVTATDISSHEHATFIFDCRCLISSFEEVDINHVCRKANHAANSYFDFSSFTAKKKKKKLFPSMQHVM